MKPTEAGIDERIWQSVAAIPAGYVATYGDVARLAGLPGAARRVGRALKDLPCDTLIPWHRVINSAGKLSLSQDSPQGQAQQQRLIDEGVSFRTSGGIDLAVYRWHP